jgi:hypothetical protein
MVDVNKRKGGSDDSSSKKKKKKGSSKKRKKSKGSSSSGSSSSGDNVDTYSPSVEDGANYDGGSVADVSKEWADRGDNLNYQAENGEREKGYVKRQVAECKEFYEDYVDTALDNLDNIENFTLVHHALMLSCGQNRVGVADVLQDEFGYSENQAIQKAHQIVSEAGEQEAFNEVTKELMKSMIKE